MSLDAFPARNTEPSVFTDKIRFVGNGAADPTEVFGQNVAVTWVATGRYLLTWKDNPGAFVGYSHGFQSTTINALRGCSVTVGVFSTTAYTMEVDVWDGLAQAAGVWVARDLAALEWLNLSIDFQRLGG